MNEPSNAIITTHKLNKKAVTTIFKDSYKYTRKYREFCERMNKEEGKLD